MLKFNFEFIKSMFDPTYVGFTKFYGYRIGVSTDLTRICLGLKQCQGGRISPNVRKLHQNYPFLYIYLAETHDFPTWVMGPSLCLTFGSSAGKMI